MFQVYLPPVGDGVRSLQAGVSPPGQASCSHFQHPISQGGGFPSFSLLFLGGEPASHMYSWQGGAGALTRRAVILHVWLYAKSFPHTTHFILSTEEETEAQKN